MRPRVLSLIAAFAVAAAGCTHQPAPSEAEPTATPEPVFTPRPLRDIRVARTPERIARGQYLTEGLLQCFLCHSERDWTKPGAPPIPALKGAGYVRPDRPWLVAPNLTPDTETGTGTWTDDMLIRAIREGIGHDGRVLSKAMWYGSFRYLPDEDVEAVVAYLRTLKPIRHPLPRTNMPADAAKELTVPEPITTTVPADAIADPVEHGRRLARLADCMGCHSSWYTPKLPGIFGGGNLIKGGTLEAYSANITSDDSGIAHYDAAFFREVMHTGKAKGRDLSPLMPWTVFRHLNDADLDALFAYLRALPKVKHLIDNVDPPTLCRICEGTHPLGKYNRPYEPKLIPVPVSSLRDTVGTYRFEDGSEMRIAIENGKLMKAEKRFCELLTEDQRTYFCKDSADRIAFVRDASGKVTGLTFSLDPAVKIR